MSKIAPALKNRRVFGAIKLLSLEQIAVLQAKCERFRRDDPHFQELGKQLIMVKRAMIVPKPA